MNTFKFIGNLIKPKDETKLINERVKCKILKFGIKQNDNNMGFVQLTAFPIPEKIMVYKKNSGERVYIESEQRFDEDILADISYGSKYTTNIGSIDGKNIEFLTALDLLEHLQMNLDSVSHNDIVTVSGIFNITEYNGKFYNNFEIKNIYIDNSAIPDLTMKLDLFYNNKSLDLSDKENRMILNGYIEQYYYPQKSKKYFPITTQFNTSAFDLKNPTHLEQIKYRKENLHPAENEGYVKSTWDCQYVRGAQMIMPPLESLSPAAKFEVKNAGRELKEYMTQVVGEAQELICLIRPDNTKTQDNSVYQSLNITNNEFLSKIYEYTKKEEIQTIDKVAQKEAFDDPFNL